MAIKGLSYILNEIYNGVEDRFREYLDNSRDSRCLLNLLKIPGGDLLTPVVKYVLRFYDTEDNVFRINGHVLCITLEDVLYLTGLPIQGAAVISDKNRDPDGFQRVFQLPETEKTPLITSLKNIVKDENRDYDTRKRAVLLLIVRCFIAPISAGHRVSPTFIKFIENFSQVDSYAWGAALLAFLYNGIKEFKEESKKSLDGNSWIILAFFLLQIPLLQKALGLNLSEGELDVPILRRIVEQVSRVSRNHRCTYEQVSEAILSNLTHNEVDWRPYTRVRTEHRMEQARNGTFMGAIICNNYVAYHKPHLAHHQFQVLENYDVDALVRKPKKIKVKKNKGGSEQNLSKLYEKHIESWNSMVLAQSKLYAANMLSDSVAKVSEQEPLVPEEHIHMNEEELFDYPENEQRVEHKGHQSGSEHVSRNHDEQPDDSPVRDNFREQLNKRPIEERCDSTTSELLQSVALEDRIWRLENILNEIKRAKLYGTSGGNLEM